MKKSVRFAEEEEEKQTAAAPPAAADMEMATQPLSPAAVDRDDLSSSSSISSSSGEEEQASPSSYVEMMNQATQPLDEPPSRAASPPPFRLNYQYSQQAAAADEMEVVQEDAEEGGGEANYQLGCGMQDARQIAIAHLTSPEGRREEEERRKMSLDHPSSEEQEEEELPARIQLAPALTTSSPQGDEQEEGEEESRPATEEEQNGLESMIVPLVTVGLKMEEVRQQEIRSALPSASMSNRLVSTIVNSFMWQMRSGEGDGGDWKHAKDNEASAWKKKLVELQRKLGANRLSSCAEGGYEMNGPIVVAVPVPNKVNWCFVLLIESLTWSEKTAGKCKQPKSERPLEQHLVSLVIPPLKEAGPGKMVFDVAGQPAFYAVPGPLWLTTLLPGSKVKRASINANHWKVLDAKSNTWLPLWDVLGLEKSNETTPIFARMKFSSEPSVRATHALCMSYENTYNPNTKENRALARAAKASSGESSSPAVSPKRRGGKKAGGKAATAKRDASPKRGGGGRKKKAAAAAVVVDESKREKRERRKLEKKAEKKLMRKELLEMEGDGSKKKKKGRKASLAKEKLSHDEVLRYIRRHPSMFEEVQE